jgi:hypothetical protein
VQILVGLLSLETSSSGSVLISCAGTFCVAPALAPIGVIPALKKGELCRLGRAKASRMARKINRGMLGNVNEGTERWAMMLCRSESDWGLSHLNAPSVSSGSEISISPCKPTCFRSLESNLFNLASRIASSPQRPAPTNAEPRLRSETIDGEGKDSVVAGAAEMLRLDGPERVRQGYRKAGKVGGQRNLVFVNVGQAAALVFP